MAIILYFIEKKKREKQIKEKYRLRCENSNQSNQSNQTGKCRTPRHSFSLLRFHEQLNFFHGFWWLFVGAMKNFLLTELNFLFVWFTKMVLCSSVIDSVSRNISLLNVLLASVFKRASDAIDDCASTQPPIGWNKRNSCY